MDDFGDIGRFISLRPDRKAYRQPLSRTSSFVGLHMASGHTSWLLSSPAEEIQSVVRCRKSPQARRAEVGLELVRVTVDPELKSYSYTVHKRSEPLCLALLR